MVTLKLGQLAGSTEHTCCLHIHARDNWAILLLIRWPMLLICTSTNLDFRGWRKKVHPRYRQQLNKWNATFNQESLQRISPVGAQIESRHCLQLNELKTAQRIVTTVSKQDPTRMSFWDLLVIRLRHKLNKIKLSSQFSFEDNFFALPQAKKKLHLTCFFKSNLRLLTMQVFLCDSLDRRSLNSI